MGGMEGQVVARATTEVWGGGEAGHVPQGTMLGYVHRKKTTTGATN